MRFKHGNRPFYNRLNDDFWTINQVPSLVILRGYLVTADLLSMAVIEHQGLVKQLGLAYLPVDTTQEPLLHPLDSFQARNSIDVTEVNFRPDMRATMSSRSSGHCSEEMVRSADVPEAVQARVSAYVSRSQMNGRGLVLVGWSMFDSAAWLSRHCPQLIGSNGGCFIGWADVQDYAQDLARRGPTDFPNIGKTMKALQINDDIGHSSEKLNTRAGHRVIRILQVLIGLEGAARASTQLEVGRQQKRCRRFWQHPGTTGSKYQFAALLKPSDPVHVLPATLSRTVPEFLDQFPQIYKPVAIGFERWRDDRPHRKGDETRRAYVCFASADETDRFVSEMDGAVIGGQSLEISRSERLVG